jgi:uncharacterized protein
LRVYENGCGIVKDEIKAFEWYMKLAKQKYAIAQNNLGVMYENGRGVAKNEIKAFK